jgi:hypothetical protein
MTKIINKNQTCENIEGLLQYERFQMLQSPKEEQLDFLALYGQQMREAYCGTMCFKRYSCAIAERYLPK